jgi:hypothetical protein
MMICNILQISAIIALVFSIICACVLLLRAVFNRFDKHSDVTLWQLLFTGLITGGLLLGSAYKLDCPRQVSSPVSPKNIRIEKPASKVK